MTPAPATGYTALVRELRGWATNDLIVPSAARAALCAAASCIETLVLERASVVEASAAWQAESETRADQLAAERDHYIAAFNSAIESKLAERALANQAEASLADMRAELDELQNEHSAHLEVFDDIARQRDEMEARTRDVCRWQRHESNHPPLCGRVTCGPYSVHISCERFGGGCRAWEPREEPR